MKTKLDQPVRTLDGEVTTIAKLAEQGRIRFECVERFQGSARGPIRRAYFAVMDDGGCWEIGQYAYRSRTQSEAA